MESIREVLEAKGYCQYSSDFVDPKVKMGYRWIILWVAYLPNGEENNDKPMIVSYDQNVVDEQMPERFFVEDDNDTILYEIKDIAQIP